jgi:methylmalonyl-CoA/ethylmalonyl-CoA epimerase
MLKRVHHIDYVVRDLEQALEQMRRLFSLEPVTLKVLEGSRKVALFEIGDLRLALVEPLDGQESLAGRWLREHGEGFFHIAFEVDNLDESVAQLEGKGVAFLEKPKHPGLGWRVVTLDPRCTLGVLTQLVGE